MDNWLAQIYGTAQADDIEKTAQIHLLAKLAEEQGIDINTLSDDQINALASEFLDDGSQQAAPQAATQVAAAPVAAAPAFDANALAKEAQAKFEEADLLGRVMAHAYTQELEKIAAEKEKTAGRFGAVAAKGKAFGASAKQHAGKAVEHVKGHKGHYGAAAAGLAAGEAHGRMRKHASAFDKLAEMQAAEMLSAAGFDPSTGQDTTQQAQQHQQPQQSQQPQGQDPGQVQGMLNQQPQAAQPQQDPQAEFQQALDTRALEMLQAAGYDVNEIIARLSQGQGQA
jgi:hypothetical protein